MDKGGPPGETLPAKRHLANLDERMSQRTTDQVVIFYTNANDLSSIRYQDESDYLVEDIADQHEQAQLISDIASHGQRYNQNGEYFRLKNPSESSNFSTKPTKGNLDFVPPVDSWTVTCCKYLP